MIHILILAGQAVAVLGLLAEGVLWIVATVRLAFAILRLPGRSERFTLIDFLNTASCGVACGVGGMLLGFLMMWLGSVLG